ncbi:TIGR02300 family protein [Caulobacter sp. NIBR2454]|uniref:TIGR02300 family protein n=1 Tax=Caulobacter sp. NIBR2454 TaxID=3015996 RepID=UPI0022B679D2|nr:TIGR02300 family protein [Caulobacter sp. NIBR2454]
MANPELGAKQICPNCQSKFYDLGKRPAACPKCGEQFDPEEAIRSRRVRARAVTPDYDSDDEKEAQVKQPETEDGFEDEVDQTPEIDEAAEEVVETDDGDDSEPGVVAPGGDDLGVDFAEDEDLAEEEADDVPFLEDEEEDFEDADIEIPGAGDEEDR